MRRRLEVRLTGCYQTEIKVIKRDEGNWEFTNEQFEGSSDAMNIPN